MISQRVVTAKIAMDEELNIRYAAYALGGRLPCGYHETKQEAIAVGEAWLSERTYPGRLIAVTSVSDDLSKSVVADWSAWLTDK